MTKRRADQKRAVRVNISVPPGLRARMHSLGRSVNWSAVAAEAFQARVLRSQIQGEDEMARAIARLRAAANVEPTRDYDEGLEAGRAWAMNVATPRELRLLAGFIEEADTDGADWWDVDQPGWNVNHTPPENFVHAIRPNTADDPDATSEFWEAVLGEKMKPRAWNGEFLRGFGEGALQFWEQVRDSI